MKAILMLEDGKSFQGEALGGRGERIGKVIFNTAVVGYQEMMTDPANSGKSLVLTYPLMEIMVARRNLMNLEMSGCRGW